VVGSIAESGIMAMAGLGGVAVGGWITARNQKLLFAASVKRANDIAY
jgi:hypothetical protein